MATFKFLDLDTGVPTLWAAIKGKFVAKESGKGLSSNDYTSTEKTKLSGIETGANKYTLPTAAADTLGGVKVGANLTITNGVLAADAPSYNEASQSAAGLMSATDKKNLDTINSNYLSKTSASGTYLSKTDAGKTYLTQTSASGTYLTKTDASSIYQTAQQVQSAINSSMTSAVIFKGTVSTEGDLPTENNKNGDMYNISSASSYGAAGMNVAWDGKAWDAMGASFTVEAASASEINAKCV